VKNHRMSVNLKKNNIDGEQRKFSLENKIKFEFCVNSGGLIKNNIKILKESPKKIRTTIGMKEKNNSSKMLNSLYLIKIDKISNLDLPSKFKITQK
jgi:hypothetical protein